MNLNNYQSEEKTKIENAEKLLKIAKANRVNSYVDVTPFVLDYCVPFVDYDGFFCAKGEVVVYACPANVFKDKEQVIGYRGRSMGSSVRITKGWYMRRSRSGSSAIRAEIRKYYNGDLIVTNKRIVFIGKDESFECGVEKIGAIKLLSKGSFVLQFGRTSENISVDINITEYAYGLINYVVKAHRDGEDVCRMVEKSYADMTEEQKALCERVKQETDQLKIPKEKGANSGLWNIVKILWVIVGLVAVIGIAIAIGNSCSKDNPPSSSDNIYVQSFNCTEEQALDMETVFEETGIVLTKKNNVSRVQDYDNLYHNNTICYRIYDCAKYQQLGTTHNATAYLFVNNDYDIIDIEMEDCFLYNNGEFVQTAQFVLTVGQYKKYFTTPCPISINGGTIVKNDETYEVELNLQNNTEKTYDKSIHLYIRCKDSNGEILKHTEGYTWVNVRIPYNFHISANGYQNIDVNITGFENISSIDVCIYSVGIDNWTSWGISEAYLTTEIANEFCVFKTIYLK